MKRAIFILILCSHILSGLASNPLTEIDSLKEQLAHMPHDTTRLRAIRHLIKLEQATPKCLFYADMLLKEAILQHHPRYTGSAIYSQLIYYYNKNNIDSVRTKLNELEKYIYKANLWDYYFDAQRCLIDLYTYQEQFELALNKSNEMYQKAQKAKNFRGLIGAKQSLANVYMSTEEWGKGKQALIDAHQLLEQTDDFFIRNAVLCQLMSFSISRKEYNELWLYLHEQQEAINTFLKKDPLMKETIRDFLIFNKVYYAYYYAEKKQLSKMAEVLRKATKEIDSNTYFIYRALYHDAYARYYRINKKYDESIAHLDSTILLLKPELSTNYINQLSQKADVLVEAGRSKEALPIYQSVLSKKELLEQQISDKQMVHIQEKYHLNKLILEEKRLKNEIQLIAFVAIFIALLVLTFFALRNYSVRKALKIAESDTRKAAKMAEDANEMKGRFLSNMSFNIRIPLNSVVGFSQLIAIEPNMDESLRKEYSAIIQKSSNELLRLVNDILDLSRLEARMMKFQLQEYDVVTLCNEIIYMSRMKNEESIQIHFHTNIHTQNIITDIARLEQVLLSTMTYFGEERKKREIKFTVMLDSEAELIRFHIVNTPLADQAFVTQETSIRNDINRLLLEYFGGSYTIIVETPEGPTIDLTYPLNGISQ